MVYVIIVVALLSIGAYAGYYFTSKKNKVAVVAAPAPVVPVASSDGASNVDKK